MGEYAYLKPAREAGFKDSGVTKFGEVIRQADEAQGIGGYGIIGCPLSKPSISTSGAAGTPAVLRRILNQTATFAAEDGLDLATLPITDLGDVVMHVTDTHESHNRIESAVSEVLKQNPGLFPVIFGGDHSISAPAIKGFAESKGRVGIIQFDAHHDLRNLDDGGPSNGTPFRNLVDSGTIRGEDLVQIGIRNFANSAPYTDFAREKGVTVFTMKDVREQGILRVVKEAVAILEHKVDAIYISTDIDVIDQSQAPGCPAIFPGGMYTDDLFAAIRHLGGIPAVRGLDIVEIDPSKDVRDMTSRIGVFTLLNFLIGRKNQ